MANDLTPVFESADRITGQASAAITGRRFVKISGNKTSALIPSGAAQVGASDPTEGGNYQFAQCVLNDAAIGVSTWDAAIGEKVGAVREGIVPMPAGSTITFGQAVGSDANGMAIPATAAVRVLGTAMSGSGTVSVAGDKDVEVLLQLINVVA
jgi:hypothetical protein